MAVNYPGVDEVLVERHDTSRPHEGKTFACIQAHSDDIPLSCGGLLAKLVAEGYTGYLIQTTNDMMCGPTSSAGETILQVRPRPPAALSALTPRHPTPLPSPPSCRRTSRRWTRWRRRWACRCP